MLLAAGFGLFATLNPDSGYLSFLVATLVIGAGAALAMTPATNAIVGSLPRAKQGVASAVILTGGPPARCKIPFTCQFPTSYANTPFVRYFFPFPNGSS